MLRVYDFLKIVKRNSRYLPKERRSGCSQSLSGVYYRLSGKNGKSTERGRRYHYIHEGFVTKMMRVREVRRTDILRDKVESRDHRVCRDLHSLTVTSPLHTRLLTYLLTFPLLGRFTE